MTHDKKHTQRLPVEIQPVIDDLEAVARPPDRVKLGSLLASIAREAGGLTDAEVEHFNQLRIKSPARAVSFE